MDKAKRKGRGRNEVKLIFKLTDDGTLKLVTDKAKKAKKATDDLTSSTEKQPMLEIGIIKLKKVLQD